MTDKNELRQKALGVRRSLSPGELASKSELVEARLYGLPEYADAKTLATYAAMPDEVRTASIIAHSLDAGKRVLVPKTDPTAMRLIFSEVRGGGEELAPGRMGILEPRPEFLRPVDLGEADLVLVPVVAWDERGYRLGYGMGYFDRALGALRHPVTTIGLALEIQRFEEIPADTHDVPLAMIITEARLVRTGRDGAS